MTEKCSIHYHACECREAKFARVIETAKAGINLLESAYPYIMASSIFCSLKMAIKMAICDFEGKK